MHFQKCHSSPVRSNYCFKTYVCVHKMQWHRLFIWLAVPLTLPLLWPADAAFTHISITTVRTQVNSCIFPLPPFPLLSECASYISRRRVLWSPAFVCLSAAACLHYCTDPDVNWGSGRECPLVVRYWADLRLVHGLVCYGNIMQTLVTSLPAPRDMTT